MSVAVLLAVFGSYTVAGAVTVAVLASVPDAVAASVVRFIVRNVTVPPGAMFTVRLMLPMPLAPPPQVDPAVAAQDQAMRLTGVGKASLTTAPATGFGPGLLATITYRTGLPGVIVVVLSVLVIDRSACGMIVSVSVALLSAGFGSVVPIGAVTVAVLASEPVAVAASVAVTVMVALPPDGRLTVALTLPVPVAAAAGAPPGRARPRRAGERGGEVVDDGRADRRRRDRCWRRRACR